LTNTRQSRGVNIGNSYYIVLNLPSVSSEEAWERGTERDKFMVEIERDNSRQWRTVDCLSKVICFVN
jgi:hypothetical protein